VPDHPEVPLARAEHHIGELRYDMQPGPGYLRIEYAGEVDSIATADAWIEHIEATLREHGLEKVLWDSRPAMQLPTEVRAHIWAWLERREVVKVSAILVHSELLRVSANLSGMGTKLVLKAFGEPDVAIGWLCDVKTS